ncbi:MAG: hypothetical protein JSS02_27315 [Planctomycetes bacterium]|nr:hypothetical protein [Planctomycetota bacterium]
MGFHPLKSGADEVDFAHGVADSHGRYSLAMPEHGPGAIPGEYVVTVTHPEGGLPSRYKSEDSSPLRVTVPDQETNDVPLELTD